MLRRAPSLRSATLRRHAHRRGLASAGTTADGTPSFEPYATEDPKPVSLIQSMLPEGHQSPMVLSTTLNNGLELHIGAATSLHKRRPGNGGFRLMEYPSAEKCIEECVGLAQGMVREGRNQTVWKGGELGRVEGRSAFVCAFLFVLCLARGCSQGLQVHGGALGL